MSLLTAVKDLEKAEQQLLIGSEHIVGLLDGAGAAPTELLAEYNQLVSSQYAAIKSLAQFWRQTGQDVYGEPTWLPRFSLENWSAPVTETPSVSVIRGGSDGNTGPGNGELGSSAPLGWLAALPWAVQGVRLAGMYFMYKGAKAISSPWAADTARYEAMAAQAKANAASFKLLAEKVTLLTQQCAGSDPKRYAQCVRDITTQMATIKDGLPKNPTITAGSSAIKTLGWFVLTAGIGYGIYRGVKWYTSEGRQYERESRDRRHALSSWEEDD
jgi:hypothetical protein